MQTRSGLGADKASLRNFHHAAELSYGPRPMEKLPRQRVQTHLESANVSALEWRFCLGISNLSVLKDSFPSLLAVA